MVTSMLQDLIVVTHVHKLITMCHYQLGQGQSFPSVFTRRFFQGCFAFLMVLCNYLVEKIFKFLQSAFGQVVVLVKSAWVFAELHYDVFQ